MILCAFPEIADGTNDLPSGSPEVLFGLTSDTQLFFGSPPNQFSENHPDVLEDGGCASETLDGLEAVVWAVDRLLGVRIHCRPCEFQ